MSIDVYIEVIGAIIGFFYVYFQIKQKPVMWIVGILAAVFYVCVFFRSAVYANMFLQMYYVVACVYGFWMWKYRAAPQQSGDIFYRRLTPLLGCVIGVSLAGIGTGAYFVLSRYTDSTVPIGDAFTAAAGIVATWMLAHRIIEHWFFWMVSDSVSVLLYYHLGLYPTMLLYLCYVILAVAGYMTWVKKGTRQYDSPL